MNCHVTFKTDKAVVAVETWSMENVVNAIKNEFSITQPISLQVFNRDFEEWVTLKSLEMLPEKPKLKVILSDDSDPPHVERSTSAANSPPKENESAWQAPISPGQQKVWPIVYNLPPFPPALMDKLSNAKSVTTLDHRSMMDTVKILYQDMIQYTIYPTSHQYNDVCNALVRRFPHLKDRIVLSDKNATVHKTWLSTLTTKFKSERQKLTSDEQVALMRKKFGCNSRKRRTDDSDPLSPSAKRTSDRSLLLDVEGEDDDSIAQHVIVMKNEMKKVSPDHSILRDRMTRTLSARRKLIGESQLQDVLDEYPALTLYSMLVVDVKEITGQEILTSLQKFFTSDRVHNIMAVVRQQAQLKSIIDVVSSVSTIDQQTQELSCALILLPAVFREKPENWFIINEEPRQVTPIMKIQTSSMTHLFVDHDTTLAIYLDRLKVAEAPSYLSAVASVLATYWVFNVSIPKSLMRTVSVLAGHICKLEAFKPTPAIQRGLNAIYG